MSLIDTEHKRKSMTITVILHVILLLLLFFVGGLPYFDPPIENGIAVNFGTLDTGSGDIQPTEAIKSAPKETTTETTTQPESEIEEEVITQENDDAPVIEKEENPKEETVTTEDKPVEEEKIPDPQPDESTTNALSNLINGPNSDGTETGGEGDDDTNGDKGDPNGDPNATNYYGTGKGIDGDGNYLLGGRKALNKEIFIQDCNEAGIVVVSIEVNRNGKVISATPGVRGTTNNSRCLLEPAKRAALATRFNSDDKAPTKQIGKIIYRFSLSD